MVFGAEDRFVYAVCFLIRLMVELCFVKQPLDEAKLNKNIAQFSGLVKRSLGQIINQ